MFFFRFTFLILPWVFFGGSCDENQTQKTQSDDKNCHVLSEFSDKNITVKDCSVASKRPTELHISWKFDTKRVLEYLAMSDKTDHIALTRVIHKLADRYKLNKWGFDFYAEKESPYFVMSARENSDKTGTGTITLDMPSLSAPPSEYKTYIDQGKAYSGADAATRLVNASTHSVSFFSNSGNRLVIPKVNYLTVYHFSRDATDAEIDDLWAHVSGEMFVLYGHPQKKWSRLAIHTGSEYAQTVPHFHLRIEK